MAKLIDAKALEKQIEESFEDTNPVLMGQMLRWVRKQTTIDAVPVVRCKDCKHRVYVDMGDEIGEIGGCKLFKMAMPYDNFCSYGERKDNG